MIEFLLGNHGDRVRATRSPVSSPVCWLHHGRGDRDESTTSRPATANTDLASTTDTTWNISARRSGQLAIVELPPPRSPDADEDSRKRLMPMAPEGVQLASYLEIILGQGDWRTR